MKKHKLTVLDEAISAEAETIKSLEAKLEKTLADKTEAERAQQEIAYLAETGNDPEARAKLEQVEETLFKAEKRTRSLEIAVAKANEKLNDLREQRQAVFIAEKKREYGAECAALIKEDGSRLEQTLTHMSQARDALRLRLRKMEAIAQEAGLDVTHTHNRIREGLRHCVEQRAGFQPIWMSRDTRETFKQPVAVILQFVLKAIVPEIEEQERRSA